MNPIRLPSNPRVLVVVLRRLGDVLLTTPLIRSIKRAYPDAAIEALVFAGTEGILAGNPDLAGVIAMPRRPGAGASLALLRRLARRYDLALSVQPGDRPTTLASIAGRQSAGLLEASGLSASLKRLALSRSCATDRGQHRVLDTLRLAELLGIPALPEIVCPAGAVRAGLVPPQPYAVVHAAPMFTYKRWRIEGWRRWFGHSRGLPPRQRLIDRRHDLRYRELIEALAMAVDAALATTAAMQQRPRRASRPAAPSGHD